MKEVKLSSKIYSKDFSIKSLGYSCEVESSSSANFSNIELLNRIANLESMVQQLLDNNKDKS